MRNLFQQHAQENEKQAKAAMTDVAARIIGKYINYQGFLNKHLSGGGRSNEDGKCLLCIVNETTKRMAKLEVQVGQIQKTYNLMFGEEMDIPGITEAATREFYPLTRARTRKEKETGRDDDGSTPEGNIYMPDDMPEDLKEAFNHFAESLRKRDKGNFEMHVIDGRKGDKYGINPLDYNNPRDFFEALHNAQQAQGKPGEEVIKENIIHNVEEMAKEEQTKPKRTKRTNFGKDKEPKLN